MKKSVLFLFLFLSLVVVKAQKIAEKQVKAAVEQLKNAMVTADKDVLLGLTAPNLSYGHSSGKIESQSAFVETLSTGKSDFVSIDFKNQTLEISGKTALVRHELHAITNDGGKAGEVHIGVLLVWQKQNKEWKLLGRQAFKLP